VVERYSDSDFDADMPSRELWWERIKDGLRVGVIAAEVSPANEVMRLSVFAASQVNGGDTLLGALAYGGSTLVIEGLAARATSPLLSKDEPSKVISTIHEKLQGITKTEYPSMSLPLEASLGLLGGSAVSMTAKKLVQPEMSERELRRYGGRMAAALGAVCTLQGALMAQGFESLDLTSAIGVSAATLAGVAGLANYTKNRSLERTEIPKLHELICESERGLYSINKRNLFITQEIDINGDAAKYALELEQRIWDKHEFGSAVADYAHLTDQTQMIVSRTPEKILGVARMFKGGAEALPFMTLEFNDQDEHDRYDEACRNGEVEEVGTSARDENVPKGVIARELWRLAYRDARHRGVKKWGIIMEPERVEKMNDESGFLFRRIGPVTDYQGGDCAPHVMDLDEVYNEMRKRKPLQFYWFTQKKLEQ